VRDEASHEAEAGHTAQPVLLDDDSGRVPVHLLDLRWRRRLIQVVRRLVSVNKKRRKKMMVEKRKRIEQGDFGTNNAVH